MHALPKCTAFFHPGIRSPILIQGSLLYACLLYTSANGDYKAKLTVWRLPQDYLATQFEGGTTGAIRKNLGVEHPAKPTGLSLIHI